MPPLTAEEARRLGQALNFTSPVELGRVFDLLGWSLDDEIRELIGVAQQDINLSAKVSAIKALRGILYENLRHSGLIRQVRETGRTHDEQGQHELSASRVYTIIQGVQPARGDSDPRKGDG